MSDTPQIGKHFVVKTVHIHRSMTTTFSVMQRSYKIFTFSESERFEHPTRIYETTNPQMDDSHLSPDFLFELFGLAAR